ncbi:p21-activated protein kinase-interacting protein 1-like [Psilocybe cubensis]|uniref:WD40 repeat-like protein n=2 Tax=Psilocybe cubensis TaxID=181762 RepID=A0A8H7XV55_PSICU|nr:p21-activated protein kinase-interacting protein 1-like [Psilocybe cubensis]KAH9479299.1 p21-activated protein kinase-interacting protein 1-like [Psilocybe cubensis]
MTVKHSQNKGVTRPAKKAKIEVPSKTKISPSPKRNSLPQQAQSRKVTTPHEDNGEEIHGISEKGKGKEKEVSTASKPKVKRKTHEEKAQLPNSFKVVAGSYEKLLYGLEGTVTVDEDLKLKYELKPTFIFPAHVSCIKAVAASPQGGKWLATGSADEIIKVWDLRRRKEIGGLMHHEGSITHLTFPSRSHLFSASEDGTLCLFRARDWAVLRSLKGHKGRVNSMAVHPSGKVALSVGKDRALRMWDLMRGKGVASTKLGKEGEIVRWSIDGSKFLVQSASTMDVYAVNMDLLYTITHPSRIHDAKFCSRVDGEGELLLVAAEDRKLSIYDVPKDSSSPKIIAHLTGHTNRVKAVDTLNIALPESSGRKSTTILVTVSSDGFINLHDIAAVSKLSNKSDTVQAFEPLTSYDSKGTRLTCVTLGDGDIAGASAPVDGKRKRDASEEPDDSGSENDNDDEGDADAFGAGWEEEEEIQEEDEEEDEEEGEEESE